MAIVASNGPIPFGGNASVKMIFGENPTKLQLNKIYKRAFYRFFSDFKDAMNEHFPSGTGKVSFIFSEIENKEWINAVPLKSPVNIDDFLGRVMWGWAEVEQVPVKWAFSRRG